MTVTKNQQDNQRHSQQKQDQAYKSHQKEVRDRLKAKSDLDQARSTSHFNDVQSSKERRVTTAINNRRYEEKRITGGLNTFTDKLYWNHTRA